MAQIIDPVQGRLLVQLRGKYKNIESADERFGSTKARGIVLAIAPGIADDCKEMNIKVGDMVYFGAYEDTARYGADDDLILIKLEEVGGRSDGDKAAA